MSGITMHRGTVLAAACLGVFVGFGSLFIFTFGVFLKPLSAEFGWSRAQVSSGFLVAVLTVAMCSPFLGRLVDRYPARRIAIPCMLVYGVGFASLGLLNGRFWQFIAVLALLGAVGNGTTQLVYARVVSAWFNASRGRALAAVMAGSGLGAAVFPSLAQLLISTYGWRFAYALLGAAILVVGLPLTVAGLYEPVELKANIAKTQVDGSVWAHVKSRPFLGIASALLLFSLATNGLNTHWVSILTDRAFTPSTAAAVLSVAGLAALGSKLSTGILLDRFQANHVVASLIALCAVGILPVIYGAGIQAAFVSAILVGLGMGAESDAVPYLLTRYFGLQHFSELYGYTWCVYAVAGGLGPLLAGVAFDATHSYRTVLLCFCLLTVLSSGIFAVLPKYGRKEVSMV